MLYTESYQMLHDWEAEAAESEEIKAEQNAAYWESECEAVAIFIRSSAPSV